MTELAPSDSFIVNSQRGITDFERKSLTVLYRPLLTSDAYSLIMALWELDEQTLLMQDRLNHSMLLNWLGIDIPAIIDARGQLEALGLLKSYCKQVDNRALFLYVLQTPADPIHFLKDDTLSALLLGMIGDDEFERLSNKLTNKKVALDGFYDVSKKLDDYFQLGSNIVNKAEVVKKVQHQLDDNHFQTRVEAINSDFDFKLLSQMLSTSFVDHDSLIKNEHLIMVEQTIYGINENEMAQLIKESTSYENNQIDEQVLKRKISSAYGTASNPMKKTEDVSLSNEKAHENELKGLSKDERQVVEMTYSMPPNEFIESLKAKTGGFTTAAEERVIANLVNTGMMPVSVVNFLIYYFLVDQERATLNKNLIETIANDWIKNKIMTPVDAIKFIRTRQDKKKNNAKNYTNRRRVVQRETLPDWSTTASKENTSKKANPQTTKSINEQLKKLRSRDKEE